MPSAEYVTTYRVKHDRITVLEARVAALEKVLADHAQQLDALGTRLGSSGRPGHCDYISKGNASDWSYALAHSLRAALAKK